MPKEAQFNVKEKLQLALHLFWRQGYNATSMADLKSEMGLNPGSIYSAYGNKRDLYIKSLALYEESVDYLFARIAKIDSPKERILYLFNSILKEVKGKECKGCFMLNASLEVAPQDREVQTLADKATLRMRNFFREELLKAQAKKEVSKSLDPDSVSELLILILFGMRVRSRGLPKRAELESALNQVEALLAS